MIVDERNWSVTKTGKALGKIDAEFSYRASVDGVELQAEIRVTGSQLAQYGEPALVGWCRRHSDLLNRNSVVYAELS